jgi:LysR family cys regulon transcriptional activator
MSDSPERIVNFQQLKIIREAARRDYNLTEVANMLYTSQSGVSRHIRELEEELGIEIFIRRNSTGCREPANRRPSRKASRGAQRA